MITTELTSVSPLARPLLTTAARHGVRYFKTGYWRYSPSSDVRAQIASAGAALTDLAALARDCGIEMGFHNHAGYIGGALWDIAPTIDRLDPKWAGYYFDPRHAVAEGGGGTWISRAAASDGSSLTAGLRRGRRGGFACHRRQHARLPTPKAAGQHDGWIGLRTMAASTPTTARPNVVPYFGGRVRICTTRRGRCNRRSPPSNRTPASPGRPTAGARAATAVRAPPRRSQLAPANCTIAEWSLSPRTQPRLSIPVRRSATSKLVRGYGGMGRRCAVLVLLALVSPAGARAETQQVVAARRAWWTSPWTTTAGRSW